jgi:hypothetical protein
MGALDELDAMEQPQPKPSGALAELDALDAPEQPTAVKPVGFLERLKE